MYIYIAIAFLTLLYYIYKRFRGPTYSPGTVSYQAARHPIAFDDPHLHILTTPNTWHMPHSIQLHYKTVPSTSFAPLHAICVHGGPAIAPMCPWEVCSEPSLTAHATFHMFHQRGSGLSTRPFDKFPTKSFYPGCIQLEAMLGLAAQIADIERARRRLGAQTVALVGHSFGGFIATLYAAEFPENVSSLVLLTPASMLYTSTKAFDLFKAIRDRLTTDDDKAQFDDFVKRYLSFGRLPTMDESSVARMQGEFATYFRKASPNMPVDEQSELVVGGWAVYATYLSLGMEHDYRRALKRRLVGAKFRTVIVNGRDDIVPVDEAKPYAELFPKDSVQQSVIGGGHFLPNERPKELAEAIRPVLLSRPSE